MDTIKRRDFVKTVSLAGAGLLAAPMAMAKPGPSGKAGNQAWRIHFFSKHLQFLDYEGAADACVQAGMDGADLTVRPGGHVLPENVERDLPRAVKAFKNAGLNIEMMASGITDPEDPLTDKVLRINTGLKKLGEFLPLNQRRIYTSGYDMGGQLATLVPSLIRPVRGVLSIGSGLGTPELIGDAGSFEFVGVMGRADYQYSDMRAAEEFLDRKKIRNHVLYHPGGHQWPDARYMDLGMQFLNLMAMKDPGTEKDTAYIRTSYEHFKEYIMALEGSGDFLLTLDQVEEGLSLYDALIDTDWLKDRRKELRKNRTYRAQKRDWEQARVQELMLTEDYGFYLAEDVNSFNLNNLGWWNYQMEKINKYKNSDEGEERLMGQRLEGYLNALISDFIDTYGIGEKPDDDALILLHMLKTITDPENYDHYLKVISYTAKYGDFGTANFYLEELLKRGYKDADQLYTLPHTGLLRISPEFNKLVAQYLGSARYATEE